MSADTVTAAPVVTHSAPDAWAARRYYVDGEPVATVRVGESKIWQCAPDHPWGWIGGTFGHVGEHRAGCGWVMSRTDWAVYPARSWTGRFYGRLADAYAEAERLAESACRCSRPVRARLCRLVKRHDGPCVPWGESDQ